MNKNNNKLLYLISIAFTVVAYIINVNNLQLASVAIAIFGVLLSIVDIKKGSFFFFLMALAFSDFTFESVLDTDNTSSFGGIYMVNVGGGTIMVYWAILNFLIIFLKKGSWAIKHLKKQKIFLILAVSFFFSFIGFIYNLTTFSYLVIPTAISDVRIYINTFLGFLTVILIVKKKEDILKYFNVFIVILITQLIIVIANSYFVSQSKTIYTFFSGTETYLIGIALVYFLFLFKQKKQNDSLFLKISLLAGIFIIILFLFIVPSRGRMIALSFSLFLYLLYSKKWSYIIAFPLVIVAAIYVVNLINPNFYNYFLFKLSTFNPNAEGADSSQVRYIEAVNILGELFTNPYYLFFGKGFGGYFETDFMKFTGINLGAGSYSSDWIAEGKFYKPHGTWLYLLLKNGFVMTVLFYYYVVKMVIKGWGVFRKVSQTTYKIIGLSIMFLLPYVSIIMFSSKLQIVFGFLTGFAYLVMIDYMHQKRTEQKLQSLSF